MSAAVQANAFLGNLVRLGFLALAGAGGWLGWRAWHADAEHAREISALNARLEAKQKEIDRLALAVKLLKVDRRVGRIVVLEQTPVAGAGQPPPASGPRVRTKVRFEEIDAAGEPIGEPTDATIDGDVLYVDSWVVKFEDVFVEQGDPLRSASLVLFRRLFGEHQAPSDGVTLDAAGKRPDAYGGATGMSALEQEVWRDFWDFANDPGRAELLGVRAAHGEAPSMKLRKGGVYVVTLRSSGGLTIQPDPAKAGSH